MGKKERTIDYIKDKRTVSEDVKERRKQFAKTKKIILKALEEGDKSVPQLAEATGLSADEVMFNLMTLRKYGDVETGEVDDMDEYFYYKLKNKE